MRKLNLFLLLSVVFAITAVQCLAAGRIEAGGYFILTDTAPSWIAEVPALPPTPGQGSRAGFKFELLDWQSDYTGNAPGHYLRAVGLIEEGAALERASTIDAAFNPAYQTLTLHQVAIVRAGKTIDKLGSVRVTLAQREARLEQSIYDGVVSANIILDDVRVGDRVSYAYSVKGSNPVFGNRVDTVYPLMTTEQTDLLHIRIRVPSSKQISTRYIGDAQGTKVSTTGDVTEYVIRRERVPAMPMEQDWPSWYSPANLVQFSDYGTWAEVAAWASDLFRKHEDFSPELREVISGIKTQHKDPEAAARRALDFVQNEIRYVSWAMGEGSHRPSHPNEVLARRFGDCKDKTVLLVAMLRALGIPAEPALVSLRELHAIARWLPSPSLFDHVITRATIDGQIYWLDGTRRYQAGPLSKRGFTAFGKALVVDPDTNALADVVAPKEYKSEVTRRHEFTVPRAEAPAQLWTESVYAGEAAEVTRAIFAQRGREETDKETLHYLTENYADMQQSGSAVVDDNVAANVVTIKRQYTVKALFEERGDMLVGEFSGFYLRPFARIPPSTDRKTPFGLYYPWEEKQIVVINAPFVYGLRTRPTEVLETPYFSFSRKSEIVGTRLTMEYAYRALADSVPAAEVPNYAARMREMQRALSTELALRRNSETKPKANLKPPSAAGGNHGNVVKQLKDLLK